MKKKLLEFIDENIFFLSQVLLYVLYEEGINIQLNISLQQFPKWWIWLYYLTPTSWILNSLLTSQYGNINKEVKVFGETKTIAVFLNDYFGFHQDRLSMVAVVITAFPIVLIILYSLSVEKLNFQKR